MVMNEVNLERRIIKDNTNRCNFSLNTDLRDFVKELEKEYHIPSRLRLLMLNHGYWTWRYKGFRTIEDLILSYRRGIQWSEKSRKIINNLLVNYGFPQLAPKKYARS